MTLLFLQFENRDKILRNGYSVSCHTMLQPFRCPDFVLLEVVLVLHNNVAVIHWTGDEPCTSTLCLLQTPLKTILRNQRQPQKLAVLALKTSHKNQLALETSASPRNQPQKLLLEVLTPQGLSLEVSPCSRYFRTRKQPQKLSPETIPVLETSPRNQNPQKLALALETTDSPSSIILDIELSLALNSSSTDPSPWLGQISILHVCMYMYTVCGNLRKKTNNFPLLFN